jgi:cytochrome c-type biogenesis protein CcmE
MESAFFSVWHPACTEPFGNAPELLMSIASWKLWMGGTILAVAVGYLAFAGVQQGWVYYVSVDQYQTDAKYQGRRVRLMGQVAEDQFIVSATRMQANFTLRGTSHSLRINYRGTIPDMFTVGGDIVVEGRLGESGEFQADVLLTKCASKYDAKHTGMETQP